MAGNTASTLCGVVLVLVAVFATPSYVASAFVSPAVHGKLQSSSSLGERLGDLEWLHDSNERRQRPQRRRRRRRRSRPRRDWTECHLTPDMGFSEAISCASTTMGDWISSSGSATGMEQAPSTLLSVGLAAPSELAAASFSSEHPSSWFQLIADAIRNEEAPFRYAFMFPTAVAVATCAQLAGIGGAALFSPIFLLVFPLLGPDYPLSCAAAAVASALLTEVFGFASGLWGYSRRGLVDGVTARHFVVLSVPAALAGAALAKYVAAVPTVLRSAYALLMLGLAVLLWFGERPQPLDPDSMVVVDDDECEIPSPEQDLLSLRQWTVVNQNNPNGETSNTTYTYLSPPQGNVPATLATLGGSLLTGLLGVGVGEVVLPQLVRQCCMPLALAAGTSVGVVVVTALTAAVVQFLSLAAQVAEGGGDANSNLGTLLIQNVIPWSLVQYTIPGVLLGGQVAPWIASRGILKDETIEKAAAVLFFLIGMAFAAKAVLG